MYDTTLSPAGPSNKLEVELERTGSSDGVYDADKLLWFLECNVRLLMLPLETSHNSGTDALAVTTPFRETTPTESGAPGLR